MNRRGLVLDGVVELMRGKWGSGEAGREMRNEEGEVENRDGNGEGERGKAHQDGEWEEKKGETAGYRC